jgi:hypothetical protein
MSEFVYALDGIKTLTDLGYTSAASSATANTYGAWVQVIASTTEDYYVTGVSCALVYLASGSLDYYQLDIGLGAAGSEVTKAIIGIVGSNGQAVALPIPLKIPSGSRIAVRIADGVNAVGTYVVKINVVAVASVAYPVLDMVDALRINKNTALNNFSFLMVDSTDHVTPKTGLTVTAERSIDGAAFAACANAVAEVGNGVYKINLAATDLNGDVITLKFTAAGADQRTITIVTQA